MKVKVKVIAVNLKGNKVAKLGDVIDHTQLPVPENWPKLIEDGYLEHTEESEAALKAFQKAEKKALKKAKKAGKKSDKKSDKKDGPSLSELTKTQLIEYADKHGIEVDKRANKAGVYSKIVAALEVRDSEDISSKKKSNSEEEE